MTPRNKSLSAPLRGAIALSSHSDDSYLVRLEFLTLILIKIAACCLRGYFRPR